MIEISYSWLKYSETGYSSSETGFETSIFRNTASISIFFLNIKAIPWCFDHTDVKQKFLNNNHTATLSMVILGHVMYSIEKRPFLTSLCNPVQFLVWVLSFLLCSMFLPTTDMAYHFVLNVNLLSLS